jgi:hypothetical protein
VMLILMSASPAHASMASVWMVTTDMTVCATLDGRASTATST